MAVSLNPDKEVVRAVREGLKRTGGYCPCRLERTEENKCMCKEFRDQIADPEFEGFCHCMLYYKSREKGRNKMAELTITEQNFDEEVMRSDIPVLVDFWATWCGPCRMLAPTIEEIAGEMAGEVTVGKLNIDDYTDFAIGKGIVSIPTLILYKNGEEVQRVVGVQPKQAIVDMIRRAQ